MSRIEQLTSELNKTLYSHTYRFEIDTEDYVLGFKKTIKMSTKSMVKALNLEQKLRKDYGRYLSSTVQIVGIRMYKDRELRYEL